METTPIYEQVRSALQVDPERADWPHSGLPRFQEAGEPAARPDDPEWPAISPDSTSEADT